MGADLGTGTAVSFGTSGWEGLIRNTSQSGLSRPAIDKSHLGTTGGFREKIPGDLVDPGTLSLEALYEPDNPPPYSGAEELITITYPDGSTTAGNGFISDMGRETPLDELMMCPIEITWTGALTETAAGGA